MIKAIVSLKNEKNGTFPEVGMTDKTIVSGISEKIVKKLAKNYAKNRDYRVEYFQAEKIYSDPYKVETYENN